MKSVFIASSRKYYDSVKEIKHTLDTLHVKGFYPDFDFQDERAEKNEELKKKLTLKHFPEIDQVDVLYVYAKEGYVGYSVTIEIAYAYAKRKEIISSEEIRELGVKALVSKVMNPEEFVRYVSKD
ncbi:hypothetical protein HYV86_03930 [Candidatus Woesearchaeota archaeon]|nr:hypothetical protein [Candidatus Woesearchaeota archaeon]